MFAMRLYITFIFFSLSIFSLQASNLTVDQYVNYITDYITFTSSFSLPTDNSKLTNTLNSASQGKYILSLDLLFLLNFGFWKSIIFFYVFISATDFGSFDFIIIGGGAGGSLVARRLSEISSWSVLLLEAGETEDDFTNVPALNYYLRSSPMNWGYFTTPQNNSCQGKYFAFIHLGCLSLQLIIAPFPF